MSQNVGFLYGKAKVKNLSVSASSFISGINMSIGNTTSSISSGASISSQIQPSENITLNAILPPNYLGAQQYHDGIIPKEGNYYYTPSTIYTFDSWRDGNDNVENTNTVYTFSMPGSDLSLTALATKTVIESGKTNSISVTINNESQSYVSNVYGTSNYTTNTNNLSTILYIWPGENIIIGGAAKSSTTGNVGYSGCDSSNRPQSASAYMYQDTTTYYIKNIMDGTASLLSNNAPGGSSSVSVTPNVAKTYSVNGSYSVVRNSTYCNSSTTTWTNGNTNGSSTTTSSIRSTKYWFTNNANYSSGKTETYNIEIRTRSLGNSQTYATNGASSSSFRTVTSVIQGTTINGVAKGTNVISYSNRHGYATVASGTWGQTNGATTISASRRSTSSSYSTGYGANSGIAAYTGSNLSTYGTSHYMSTYPPYG